MAPLWPAEMGREGSRKVPFSRVLYLEHGRVLADLPVQEFFDAERLRAALVVPARRRVTRPGRAARERRLHPTRPGEPRTRTRREPSHRARPVRNC